MRSILYIFEQKKNLIIINQRIVVAILLKIVLYDLLQSEIVLINFHFLMF